MTCTLVVEFFLKVVSLEVVILYAAHPLLCIYYYYTYKGGIRNLVVGETFAPN